MVSLKMPRHSSASFSSLILSSTVTPHSYSEDYTPADHFGEQLRAAGYNYHGNEPMYSGVTGREFPADIYIGLVYYQRLRHMVGDKWQVRTLGPVDEMTHQPIKVRFPTKAFLYDDSRLTIARSGQEARRRYSIRGDGTRRPSRSRHFVPSPRSPDELQRLFYSLVLSTMRQRHQYRL